MILRTTDKNSKSDCVRQYMCSCSSLFAFELALWETEQGYLISFFFFFFPPSSSSFLFVEGALYSKTRQSKATIQLN